MSLTPTDPALSTTWPRDWPTALVVIIVICVPAAQIQDFLTSLALLPAVLFAGSAVRTPAARQPSDATGTQLGPEGA